MAMVFPGMDPYLEDPRLWPGVHNAMIVYVRDQLQPHLPAHYVAALEERVFVEETGRQYVPDVQIRRREPPRGEAAAAVAEVDEPLVIEAPELEVHESYIEIRDLRSNQRVVTVIEVVSASNKRPGPGRDSYLVKQAEVLRSTAHLVEIDLLRGGQHVLSVPERLLGARSGYDYVVCVNPAPPERGKYAIYLRVLAQRLPRIAVPLTGDDPAVPLDVQAAVEQVYEAGRYREVLDYRSRCIPPLEGESRLWTETLLAEALGGPSGSSGRA